MAKKVLISKISKIYAQALFDSAAETNSFDLISKQLGEVVEVLEVSSDLQIVLSNSSISLLKKVEIIDSIFADKIDKKLLSFLKILLEKDRFSELGAVLNSYNNLLALRSNQKVVEISSPIELNFENKSNVLFKLEHKLGCEIRPIWTVDESLIAGLAFKFDDTVIDTSLKSKLRNLRKNITK